ncbi:tyrosine-type recombinase/integrase [Gordonia sp. (in: high G+C Gram-positive bacteria)]|uniref:tyrosine-type recombinase/integrase n=1 Tax=Gordonia sp. (in: high G+C Gram-positive bacteria) TaxID=84139 RepID=UPI00257FC714|nr:tyrosine-type recombinase/integrase [Gordonia sp. (in: high G+C Gram-positive bacteria)]
MADLVDSWLLSLRAARKSPDTIKSYATGVRQFLAYCERERIPAVLDKPTVNAFIADLLDGGAEASTAHARQRGIRRFSSWLAAEGEIDDDPLLGIAAPKIDTKVIPSLTDSQARAMVKACKGRELRDRRDEAIVRLMLETGARAGEVVGMGTGDLDLVALTVVVRRGKGGKGRVVPISAQTGTAIDRYLRARRGHRLADTPTLWLGESGQGFTYNALYKTLGWRAELAGIPKFHPHMLRHTAASRWLAAGGSEGGLMSVAGWSSRHMIDRYVADTASSRAAEEARSLGLGDL